MWRGSAHQPRLPGEWHSVASWLAKRVPAGQGGEGRNFQLASLMAHHDREYQVSTSNSCLAPVAFKHVASKKLLGCAGLQAEQVASDQS